MKKYQPILTEKQRTAIRTACFERVEQLHRDHAGDDDGRKDLLHTCIDALHLAPEYPVGRRVRCRQPGIVEPRGRIVAPVWHVENDNGGHIYVREGEFELLPEPEGADLVGKRISVKSGVSRRLPKIADGRRTKINMHGYLGTVVGFMSNSDHDYTVILDSGLWDTFSRDEFDPID